VTENSLKAEICSVSDLLKEEKLCIPDYQRPYKWSLKHVNQLLDDLLFHMHKDVHQYRVGTVVLHRYKDKLDIVDGQQRLVTFSLILHYLKDGKDFLSRAYDNMKTNRISCDNLEKNYACIIQKLKDVVKKDDLKKFILEHCDFVVVKLVVLSEAFQFFDSQNARGKSLEPYDLLKAFHLREMRGNTDVEKLNCVKLWEKAIENQELKPLFNEYLFRIRKWVRHESAFYFTKDDINLFKGISPEPEGVYPYMLSPLMVNCFVGAESGKMFSTINGYPFQINQVIINGKRFFEYVEYYRQLLDHITHQNEATKSHAVFETILTYAGRYRTGDLYTRNLFQAALLYYIDKFGMADIEQAVWVCFRWAYTIRLDNYAVRLATMDNKALGEKSWFKVVEYSLQPNDVFNYPYTTVTENKATKAEKIAELYGINNEKKQ